MEITINVVHSIAPESQTLLGSILKSFFGGEQVAPTPAIAAPKKVAEAKPVAQVAAPVSTSAPMVEAEKVETAAHATTATATAEIPTPEAVRAAVVAKTSGDATAKAKVKTLLTEMGFANVAVITEDKRAEFLTKLAAL